MTRPRFRILSLMMIVALVGLSLAVVMLSRENASLRRENAQLRTRPFVPRTQYEWLLLQQLQSRMVGRSGTAGQGSNAANGSATATAAVTRE